VILEESNWGKTMVYQSTFLLLITTRVAVRTKCVALVIWEDSRIKRH